MNLRKTPTRIALVGTGLLACSLSRAQKNGLPVTLTSDQLSVTVLPSPLSAKKQCGFITRRITVNDPNGEGKIIEVLINMIPATTGYPAEQRAEMIKQRISTIALEYQKHNRRISPADIQYHDDPNLPTIGIGAYKKGKHILTVDPIFASMHNISQRELGTALRTNIFQMLTATPKDAAISTKLRR